MIDNFRNWSFPINDFNFILFFCYWLCFLRDIFLQLNSKSLKHILEVTASVARYISTISEYFNRLIMCVIKVVNVCVYCQLQLSSCSTAGLKSSCPGRLLLSSKTHSVWPGNILQCRYDLMLRCYLHSITTFSLIPTP